MPVYAYVETPRCDDSDAVLECGGVTGAVAVEAGDHVCLRIQDPGGVSLRFV